jgi:type IV pilus modification protein PilV
MTMTETEDQGACMKQIQPPPSAKAGFTLIETLIGISIFAIGLLAVASMQIYSVRNTTVGNIRSQATMLANQKMEEIKVTDFADLVANEVEPGIDAEGNPGGIFNRTTTITTPPAPFDTDVRQVHVEVDWSAFHGGARSVVVDSLTYERW